MHTQIWIATCTMYILIDVVIEVHCVAVYHSTLKLAFVKLGRKRDEEQLGFHTTT